MIDFDINKITGKENVSAMILDRFIDVGFTNYSLCAEVMFGPVHTIRIQSWLDKAGAANTDSGSKIRQFVYWVKMIVSNNRPGYSWEAKQFVKRCSPRLILKIFSSLRRK